ncbi:hypothetical protein [Phaeovulum sp. NW3]|uniref:hypothetical protein n=1 Tax=Phaeovulum sp. NW3 TaxID=2934933 RepID=UPI00202161FF|nr:hypothetical protein [Phaeovulum sp. NW3]MCL7466267.1 hypothetical protein [Phaeovulum sp. NW3]
MVATVSAVLALPPEMFKKVLDFAVWLDPTPGQNSTAGKQRLAATRDGTERMKKAPKIGLGLLLQRANKCFLGALSVLLETQGISRTRRTNMA